MIRCKVVPSARLRAQVFDPKYTTTEDDLPGGFIMLAGIPRVGEEIERSGGANFTVERVAWIEDDDAPWLIVS